MKILVPVKRVADPDNANKVRVSADGASIDTGGLEWKINPFDEYALEAALRLTENAATKERIGEVVLVSVAPADVASTLRQGLAMGAERALIVEADDTQLDPYGTAQILSAVVKKEAPDLVLMGKQAVDGDSSATGQMLAELLAWPMATITMRIQTEGEGALIVGREVDTGVLSLRVKLPAVLTASDRIVHPKSVNNGVTPADFAYPESDGGRYASLKGIMAAKKKPIETLSLESLGVEAHSVANYSAFAVPPQRSGEAVFVESVADLVTHLQRDAKVL